MKQTVRLSGALFSRLAYVWCAAAAVSCARKQDASLGREDAFTVAYGASEGELSPFVGDSGEDVRPSFAVRDGYFYVADKAEKKVLRFNSYGDLLALYYSPSPQIPPVPDAGGAVSMQMRAAYPFNAVGAVAADSRRRLFVADWLPPGWEEEDAGQSFVRSWVVRRFSKDGAYEGHIGQDGPGGAPFPYIDRLYTTGNDDLIVVCRTPDGLEAYWFFPDGYLLYAIPLELDALPNPFEAEGDETFRSLRTALPGWDRRTLYLIIDYYRRVSAGDAADEPTGIAYRAALLYPLDIEAGEFLPPIALPLSAEVVGQSESGWFFCVAPDGSDYAVYAVSPHSSWAPKRRLGTSPQGTTYCAFSLSPDGVLSALLAGQDSAQVVRWRTDSLIGAAVQ
jgi:hypothetical protein